MRAQAANARDVAVARRAAEQWGVLSLAELYACGLTKEAVARRVGRGGLHRLHRGVYAVGHAAVPLEGRFLAAVKAGGPDAVLSHVSAAALWGILDWDERHVEITFARTGRRHLPGVRVHRAPLAPEDRVRHLGIAVTAPARTLVDLASVLSPRALRRAAREAQASRVAGIPATVAALNRAGPWRGRQVLAGILATGSAPTRSELEDVALELICRGGLALPDVNVPLCWTGGA
jgi:Transcriptional regulator, AbiEi antitoxin